MKPVVIVGAGPAGLSCAAELAAAGRPVVLIDDNAAAGGQYFRQLPPGFAARPGHRLVRDEATFAALSRVLAAPGVTHLAATTAWAAPAPLTIAYAGAGGSGRIAASAIVVATGAQETPFPFPGWTLPGVISAGGCLNLAKGAGLVPDGRIVVAGNGPLVLVVAATLIAAGADVVAVAEAQRDRALVGAALAGFRAAPKVLATAAGYRRRILLSRARLMKGFVVAEATGGGAVRRVALAPVEAGRPGAMRKWFDVDAVVTGYGLTPGSDFARLLGCRTQWDAALGGVVPVRSATLETSVAGVFAVGDGAGIGGAPTAMLEGRLAAAAVLGRAPDPALAEAYAGLDAFRRNLNRAYAVPLAAATPETIVCRCEELTLADLAADANFPRGANRLKTSSRIGMGRCQGRNCLPRLNALLGLPLADRADDPRVRPPARPVQLRFLAADADAGPARDPDEL